MQKHNRRASDLAKKPNDLTHNWNGSISIKLTAIILWSVIIAAFVITVPIMMSYEDQRLKEYLWDNQQLINLIENDINNQQSAAHIENILRDHIEHSEAEYISVKANDINISLGSSSDANYSFPTSRIVTEFGQLITIEIQHLPLKKILIVDRIGLGSSIIAGAIIFGLFIYLVTNNILHLPILRFVESTHKLVNGQKDVRFDEERDDEFGELARFSNQMLDNINLHQKELTDINNALLIEIQNREEALAAAQQKSNFLANMSHEIRTPLSSIIGYTERLRYKDIKSEEEKTSMMDIVLQSSNHLLSLINDILDFSKIEANKLEVEPNEFSIFSTVNQTVNLLSDKAMEQSNQIKVEYEFPIPKFIDNDATRTKQILLNLCGNALRFTKNGLITIHVSFDQNTNQLIIAIEDTGIGMSEEALNRLFKPFSQANRSISNEFGGTGLGLVISKRLAELMGGDVSVISTKDIGSTFTFMIDTGFENGRELISDMDDVTIEEDQYNKPINNMKLSGKVLLVEDTLTIRNLVKAYLQDYGIEVETAINGKLGIKKALEVDYDVIIMDIQMPVMNGKEAVTLLRSVNYTTPIFALTADALTQQIEEYKNLGFTQVLTKPIDINQLLNSLSRYLHSDVASNAHNEPVDNIVKLPTPEKTYDTSNSVLDSEQGRRVINKFINGLPDTIRAIELALEKRNIKILKDVFHELKGVGGSVGFPVITQIAKDIEAPLACEDYSGIKNKIEELNRIFDNITEKSTLSI